MPSPSAPSSHPVPSLILFIGLCSQPIIRGPPNCLQSERTAWRIAARLSPKVRVGSRTASATSISIVQRERASYCTQSQDPPCCSRHRTRQVCEHPAGYTPCFFSWVSHQPSQRAATLQTLWVLESSFLHSSRLLFVHLNSLVEKYFVRDRCVDTPVDKVNCHLVFVFCHHSSHPEHIFGIEFHYHRQSYLRRPSTAKPRSSLLG